MYRLNTIDLVVSLAVQSNAAMKQVPGCTNGFMYNIQPTTRIANANELTTANVSV